MIGGEVEVLGRSISVDSEVWGGTGRSEPIPVKVRMGGGLSIPVEAKGGGGFVAVTGEIEGPDTKSAARRSSCFAARPSSSIV